VNIIKDAGYTAAQRDTCYNILVVEK
jgi:2-iminoacetate synthase ThiH